MALININSYASAGSVNDTDKVLINGQEYTALQLQEYVGGDEGTFDGSEEILIANKNTGRGQLISLAELKDFVGGSPSPVTANDILAIFVSGVPKKVTSSVMQTYLDTFDPSAISGLQVWYDATDNSTISNSGSLITQLRDKSGNNNHSNPTGSQRPTITTDTLTGMQVLQPNFTVDGSLPLTTELSNSTFTFFLAASCYDAGTYTQVLLGGSSQNDFIQPGGPAGNNQDTIVSGGGGGSQTFQDDFSLKEIVVLCLRQQSGVSQIWEFNGRNRIRTTGSVPSVNFKVGMLCNLPAFGYQMGGKFAGFVYYNAFLNDSQAQQVARYLVNQHNINPVGQYYKITGFGDSYTVGVGASTLGNSYIHRIATSLGKVVSNAGISGSRFQDIGGDGQAGYARYAKDLVEYPYRDRLYILYGFNDITNMSASAATYETQLNDMVADLIERGYPAGNIYIGTVPRMYGDANSATVQDYGDSVRDVCTAHGCHCAEVYAAQVAGGGDSLFDGDHLHPNDDGHEVIANAFLDA